MKKKYYIYLLPLLLLCNSCEKFLDKSPEDLLTLDLVFSDKTRTEDWLAGIYSSIPDPYWGFAMEIGYDPLSDDMAPSTGWEQFGWTVISKQTGNWNPTSSWSPNYWTRLQQRVRSAYIFMSRVKPNIAQKLTEEDVEIMRNEARFLVAYYYWLLTETYGVVPFNDKIVPSDAADEELMQGQIPFDRMIDWIDKELKDVSTKLPASYNIPSKYGRATSIMCLAVRARMLLFAASPLVNGNPDYKGFKNNKQEDLYNNVYDQQKWVRAQNACKELIDAAHAAGHKLYYEYNSDGSIDPFMSYQNMMFAKGNENNEILFARPSIPSYEYDKHAQPRGTGGNGGMGVTQSLVDAFFMKNGRSINDPASGYVEKGFSAQPEVRNTKWLESQGDQAGKKGQVTLEGTWNMYCNREARFYVSVLYNRAWFRREGRTTRFMQQEWDGGPTPDAPQNGYLLRKKVHPAFDPRTGANPYRPGILYRLAEAYLNYAEALNEADPNNPEIFTYLNLVRQRAGLPGYGPGAGQILLAGQSDVREAIRRERRVELNNEGLRWSDIRRWKIGEAVLDANFYGMNFNGSKLSDDENDPQAFFKRTVYQRRRFSKKNYWFPVPQSEIDKNLNLVQNPFWSN
ncbi:RagB/SusD family nutrient uptake outer membrane protein [Chitinophaga sp. 22321]|uniref:RagB/SusD family nutrient uptake outer membrane protein n=1 Tax=Chitinophaga hostae TaxID=2831022 RepID=A0ABS5IZ53_9BACT|nr:RagB/SusD family nutrient uptake outer membrane protein [Chitinophaga hostae]MBS0028241.1 RagB/SusD family nutrient uptake outer membrane protein [Chitinophaga hostae]